MNEKKTTTEKCAAREHHLRRRKQKADDLADYNLAAWLDDTTISDLDDECWLDIAIMKQLKLDDDK